MFLKYVMVLMIMKPVRHGQADTDPPKGVEGSKVEIMAVNYHACIRVLLCYTVRNIQAKLQVSLSFMKNQRPYTFNV